MHEAFDRLAEDRILREDVEGDEDLDSGEGGSSDSGGDDYSIDSGLENDYDSD